jgi:phosphoenolpyruvate carboxylase
MTHGIQAIFFDGRGGPPRAGEAKPIASMRHMARILPIMPFNSPFKAKRLPACMAPKRILSIIANSCSTAGLSTRLFEKENTISEKDRQIIEKLAQLSFEKYTALKNHNMFVPYLENKSTLKYYGKTNIGSRPYKRGDKEKLDFNDLQGDPFRGVVEPIEAECSGVLRYRNGHPDPWSMREKQID